MKDEELEQLILQKLYNVRNDQPGLINVLGLLDFSSHAITPVQANNVCEHLAEDGLIEWDSAVSSTAVGGLGKITSKGCRTVEGRDSGAAPTTHVSITGGTFHSSPIGVGSNIVQSTFASISRAPIFVDLRKAIEQSSISADDQGKLIASIEEMQKAHTTPSFTDRYKDFIALAANYMTIIGPFLPALSNMLTGHS